MVWHNGTILSGNRVIRDAEKRDALSRLYKDAKVFETEAAGIMSATHSLVIRGVSDYADSHYNEVRRKYAAATAAAFARELLREMRPRVINNLQVLPFSQRVASAPGSSGSDDRSPSEDLPDIAQVRLLEDTQGSTSDNHCMESSLG